MPSGFGLCQAGPGLKLHVEALAHGKYQIKCFRCFRQIEPESVKHFPGCDAASAFAHPRSYASQLPDVPELVPDLDERKSQLVHRIGRSHMRVPTAVYGNMTRRQGRSRCAESQEF